MPRRTRRFQIEVRADARIKISHHEAIQIPWTDCPQFGVSELMGEIQSEIGHRKEASG